MKILIACEYSGRTRDAFAALGHDVTICDKLPTDKPGKHYQGNVLDILNDGWDLMIAHPPCTRLARSGVRWLTTPPKNPPSDCTEKEKETWATLSNPEKITIMWRLFDEAVAFYEAIRNAPIPKKCIENPVMNPYAITRLGKIKRQTIQPHYFGEPMFKTTGYELHGLPELKRTHVMETPKQGTEEHKKWSWVHRCPPGPMRWKIRSTTPEKIAQAMAEQWG